MPGELQIDWCVTVSYRLVFQQNDEIIHGGKSQRLAGMAYQLARDEQQGEAVLPSLASALTAEMPMPSRRLRTSGARSS